jgi:hypothetical protein
VEQALHTDRASQPFPCRLILVVAAVFAGTAALVPRMASAEGLFDLFFGGLHNQQQRSANFFADPFGLNQAPAAARPLASSSGSGFCVRSCDGRYFPLTTRGGASPAQMCQAFCPASPTKVFFGSTIDGALSRNGERYADSENAFAYRKAMHADCTCNGRDPAGLAPVDLTLDTSLRPGDLIATTNGLVAYSGVVVGGSQDSEFIPIASFAGLTAEVRARLGEMKVAPARADLTANDTPLAEPNRDVKLPIIPAPKSVSRRAKRAELN